jgi:tRNASer (uridine44-2'-O)-methyltransferase
MIHNYLQLEIAMLQLINHPEYNSTLILRSETVRDSSIAEEVPVGVPEIVGFRSVRNIRRKLLARRPGRDPPIEQNCTLYIRCSKDSHCGDDERAGRGEEDAERISCVILSPILKPGEAMPFYHPTVTHLAFRYIASDASGDNARLRIEVVPLPSTPSAPPPTDPNSRLYRTCLALLETVHRYGYGALTNYQKRVHHDCIVPREEYQDLYLVMRERHKHLVSEWKETTDPSKHVFEARIICVRKH